MAGHVGARRTFTRGLKRKSVWIGVADQGFQAIAAGTKVIMQSLAADAGSETTVVRNRGVFSMAPGSPGADSTPIGAFGIGIVTAQAFAAGVASVPGPWTDSDWEGWMVWQAFALSWDFRDATGASFVSREQVIDSKAMRKFEDGTVLVAVVESQAAALSVSLNVRTLLLLP